MIQKIQSPLIGKTFPDFKLPDLYTNNILTNDSFFEQKNCC